MTQFKNLALKQLTDHQVRFASPALRQERLVRAERLLAEIDPARQYPYQFVFYRIMDFRPDTYPDLLIRGEDLTYDLWQFLDEVSRSLPAVPVEEVHEPVLTLAQISQRLNVSTKTITRWRERGLIGRRVLCNGKRQLAFAQSTVDRFLAANPDTVERGGRFSQLTDDEKDDILRRAKRLSSVGAGSLTEITRRIARRLNRSTETVRYTIKNFNREHPNQAIFPEVTGPLPEATKQAIWSTYRRLSKRPIDESRRTGYGDKVVNMLARRYGRTRFSIYRIINEVRAKQLLAQPLEPIYHPSFDDPALEAEILGPMPDADGYEMQRRTMKVPKDITPEHAPLYEVPLLNKEQEQHLFRQMNFLKHKAATLRAKLDPARARTQDLAQLETLQKQIGALKERLVRCNMRLVVSIAKRHAGQAENYFELESDGNMSLIRAVDKFDFSRGNKFSTYASWAIMKNFARSIPDEKKHRERYVTGHEDMFDLATDRRSSEGEIVSTQEQAVTKVNRLLETLDQREREIIRMRAGLDNYSEGMTLEEIGQHLGITKERVRQLHVRAMKKLGSVVEGQKSE